MLANGSFERSNAFLALYFSLTFFDKHLQKSWSRPNTSKPEALKSEIDQKRIAPNKVKPWTVVFLTRKQLGTSK